MARVKIRTNYQVTLPKNFIGKLEKKLNLKIKIGDEIDFDLNDNKITIKFYRRKEEQIYPKP